MSDENNNIAIIGAGAFGCAILSALQDKLNNNITMFFKEKSDFEYVQKNRKHPKIDIIFNKNVKITQDLHTAIFSAEYIFLVVPFCFANSVINDIYNVFNLHNKEINKDTIIIDCCKGILNEEPFFLHKKIKEILNTDNIVVLSGASFADEMCAKNNTLVNLASHNQNSASKVGNLFCDFLHTQITKEIEAIQLLGTMKNILAISNGFKASDSSLNSLSANIVLFLNAFIDVFEKLKYDIKTLLSSAGIGDIILTSFSSKSRNQTFGQILSKNKEQAKLYLQNNTVEGFNATFAMFNFLKYHNIELKPLTELYNILQELK